MSSLREKQDAVREHFGTHGISVTNWPLRDSPLRSISCLVGCLLIATVCGVMSRSCQMAGISGLVAVLVFWKLWIPVTTQLEPRGVVLKVLGRRRQISWRDIDRLELDSNGVFLCTNAQSLHQNALRNVFIPWGKDRESLIAFCGRLAERENDVNG